MHQIRQQANLDSHGRARDVDEITRGHVERSCVIGMNGEMVGLVPDGVVFLPSRVIQSSIASPATENNVPAPLEKSARIRAFPGTNAYGDTYPLQL